MHIYSHVSLQTMYMNGTLPTQALWEGLLLSTANAKKLLLRWLGRRPIPQSDWHLPRARIVPVQRLHAIGDILSEPFGFELAVFNECSTSSIEEKTGGENVRASGAIGEEPDAFIGCRV